MNAIGDIIQYSLAANYFVGTLPEVGKLACLNLLDHSSNTFIGRIPEALESFQMLTKLYLDNNLFYARIPISMGKAVSLQILLISQNNKNYLQIRFY
ncbi:hypothetical protein IEQ34_022542 [Dendrobium chrysotoxum]|uniref:Uncharacterized protein n=1 Tax=Dendrobium chrysotoxum TaxID=161865 RepID=A0AAV7FZA1_DENCH|nr:hypothetical protein IEQ34_022542 [Dendrobium chrysotoxum]